jgi:hypothetical protein
LNSKDDISTVGNTKNAESKYLNLSPKAGVAVSYSIIAQKIGDKSGVAAFKLKGKGYTMKNSDILNLKTNEAYEAFYDAKKAEGYDYVKVPQDANDIVVLNNNAIEYVGKKLNSESLLSKEQTPQASDVESYEGMFNPKKTGISGLDVLLKDDGYNYFYKSVSGEVVMMSPDEYLKKVREGLKTKEDANVTKDKKGAINEAINKGDKIYMPFISTKDGKFSQEGRNRAVVAKERGEKLIPVFIEKDISFDEKIAKGQEYINSAIKDGATTKEEVLSKLKEQGLHRDAIYFIDNNFEDKAVESLLSNEQPTTYSKKYDANESEAEVKKESAQPVLPETKAQKAVNPRLSALPKKKVVPTEKVEEGVGNGNERDLDYELANNKTQVPEGKGSWRKTFNETGDAMRKKDILRAIAEISSDRNELNDILEATKGLPEGLHSEINYAVEHRLKSLAEKDTQSGIKEGTDLFPKDAGLSGKELVGDALDRIANKIGGKKNLTEQEKTSLTKDVTDLAKGLIQEGKATLDNVIDKIKEAIKKRFPDLDENDLSDISENIKQKVVFDEAFQWYKDNDYTYEEAKKELDDNDVDYNEKDLKDIFAEKKEASEIFEIVEKNEKAVMSRAFLATKITSKTKDAIKNIGLVYDVEKQPLAEKQALQLINEIGIEQAYIAVKNGKIRGGQAAVIYAVAIDQMQKKILESTNDEEISDLQEEQANILEEFGIQAKEGGQFNSMLYRIYKNYGLGYSLEYRKNQWKKQNDGKISPEVEAKFEELDKKLKEYEKQVSQLEKEKQEIEDKYNDSISKGEVDELLKAEYEKGKKSGILGKVSSQRKAKVERAKKQIAEGLEDFAKAIGSILSAEGLDRPSLTKALVKIGKGLIDGGFATAENVFDKIKENIKDKFGDAIDIANYEEDINDTFSKKPKTEDDKPKVSNSRIKEIVAARREEGLKTTIDDVVAELKNDFPDGTPDRVIRNEVTGYGKTKELKGGDDATVRKIKRMGRYQSIMEDILNNKRPLRSGTQRDKIEADERAKLKEIYEGLKNLPLDATDLSKQLKTAQDAIETHLKNSIEDLDRQIKTGERPVKNKPIETNPKIEELRAERDRLLKQRNEIDNPPKSNLEKLIDKAIDFTNKLNQAKKEGNKKDQKALQIQKEATDGSITNLVDAVIKMNINPTEVELARKIKAKEAEIAKLEEKLNNNDLSKPKNKEGVMSPELDDLTKQKNDLVKELAKRRSAEEQANLHSDTLQELQDNAEISGETQITKADVDNGLISDLVQAHIEKGTPIEDVQKQIFDELKSIFPDTTERQVRNAILKQGEFKSEPKEVQDLQKQLADLKSQARLQSAIEDVQAGIVRETKAKGEKSKEVQDLQKQLADLKSQARLQSAIEDVQAGIVRETKAKGEKSKEVQDLQKQLADAKKEALNKYPKVSAKDLEKQIARIEKSITEIKRRIENKEFVKKERIKKTFFSDENWREVNKKLTEAKREKLKAQKEYDIEFYKNELANRSNGEKIADAIIDIFGLAKAMRATLDVSAPFRQGGKTIVTNNKAWRTGFKNMYAYMFNKRKFDNYLLDIENADDYLLMRESKLGITNIDAGLQAKEDLFAINLAKYTGGKLDWLADKEIKGVRIGNLNPHSASERAYSGFLNTLRITMFREGVKKLKDRGIFPEDNPKEYKDLAHYINNATGRGKNILDGQTTTKLLNATLFSQKMIRANIAMFVNIANPNISWETRKMYIGNLIGFALYTQALNALGSIIINYFDDDDDEILSNLEYNPLKTDFLKLKRGESSDKRYDATAGYSIQLRTIARFIAGKKEKDGEIIKENRGKILSSFFENKMSPLASTIYKPLMLGYHPTEFGKKAEDVELKELPYIALETFTPLQISATIDDAIKIKNETDGALTGIDLLLGLHGFSVQKYNNSGSGSNRGSSRGSDSRGSTRGESSRGSNSRGTER